MFCSDVAGFPGLSGTCIVTFKTFCYLGHIDHCFIASRTFNLGIQACWQSLCLIAADSGYQRTAHIVVLADLAERAPIIYTLSKRWLRFNFEVNSQEMFSSTGCTLWKDWTLVFIIGSLLQDKLSDGFIQYLRPKCILVFKQPRAHSFRLCLKIRCKFSADDNSNPLQPYFIQQSEFDSARLNGSGWMGQKGAKQTADKPFF